MSMNLFFRAFSQPEIEAMARNHALIEQWVWEEKKYSASTDIETAWDVLNNILDGAGFSGGQDIDDTLSNGCALISADEIKAHAQILSGWTHEQVLAGLHGLDEAADLYHLEYYLEEEEDLLEQFDKLAAFYQEAAKQGLGAVSYAA